MNEKTNKLNIIIILLVVAAVVLGYFIYSIYNKPARDHIRIAGFFVQGKLRMANRKWIIIKV